MKQDNLPISIPIFNLSNESYDIKNELIIRKILEYETPWYIEFNKNDNIYEYDLVYYKWIQKEKLTKTLIGYVEIEYCERWRDEEPPSFWYEASFLKRKIYNFNWNDKSWNKPKNNHEITIYAKFSYDYTNCFAMKIKDLIEFGEESKRSKDFSYNEAFVKLEWESPYLTRGLKNSIKMINGFMKGISYDDKKKSR